MAETKVCDCRDAVTLAIARYNLLTVTKPAMRITRDVRRVGLHSAVETRDEQVEHSSTRGAAPK